MHRRAWQAAVHRVSHSRTQLKRLSNSSSSKKKADIFKDISKRLSAGSKTQEFFSLQKKKKIEMEEGQTLKQVPILNSSRNVNQVEILGVFIWKVNKRREI